VPFDKSEGVVKATLLLGGAMSTAASAREVEDQDSELSFRFKNGPVQIFAHRELTLCHHLSF